MKATLFEYRYRYLLHTLVYVLGFTAPWNIWLPIEPPGPNAHAWGLLGMNLARVGIRDVAVAYKLLLWVAIACALMGAFLRTWGSSYLGANVVQSATMHTAVNAAVNAPTPGIIEAGPYRYMRNPLYLGTILHTLALALIMPRSGAVFALAIIPVFQMRLIFAEEPFLLSRLGAPYATYCSVVPRLIPSLRPRIAPQPLIPRWRQAVLGESYMWGVAICFAVAGWQYNAWLLIQCVVVSFGVSIVIRALVSSRTEA